MGERGRLLRVNLWSFEVRCAVASRGHPRNATGSAICAWVSHSQRLWAWCLLGASGFWVNCQTARRSFQPSPLVTDVLVGSLLLKDPPAGFPRCYRIAIFFERQCFLLSNYSQSLMNPQFCEAFLFMEKKGNLLRQLSLSSRNSRYSKRSL